MNSQTLNKCEQLNMGLLLNKIQQTYNTSNDFGVTSGFCQRYVQRSIQAIGFKTQTGLNAWDAYALLKGGDSIARYFPTINKGYSNSELLSEINNGQSNRFKFCLVYGFYQESEKINQSVTVLNNNLNRTGARAVNLRLNVPQFIIERGYDINPITHVGVWTNNKFYNVIKRGLIDYPSASFYPVSWYDITGKMEDIDRTISSDK